MAVKKGKGVFASFPEDWQGQDDARALMHAREVQADPKRHATAQKHLKKLQEEHLNKAAGAIAAQQDADKPSQNVGRSIARMFKKRK